MSASDNFQNMLRRLADLEYQVAHTMRPGTVHEVKAEGGEQKVRVKYGWKADGSPLLGPWMFTNEHRGSHREETKYKPGQNVMMMSPAGDHSRAVLTPYSENNDYQRPDHATDQAHTYQFDALRKLTKGDLHEVWLAAEKQAAAALGGGLGGLTGSLGNLSGLANGFSGMAGGLMQQLGGVLGGTDLQSMAGQMQSMLSSVAGHSFDLSGIAGLLNGQMAGMLGNVGGLMDQLNALTASFSSHQFTDLLAAHTNDMSNMLAQFVGGDLAHLSGVLSSLTGSEIQQLISTVGGSMPMVGKLDPIAIANLAHAGDLFDPALQIVTGVSMMHQDVTGMVERVGALTARVDDLMANVGNLPAMAQQLVTEMGGVAGASGLIGTAQSLLSGMQGMVGAASEIASPQGLQSLAGDLFGMSSGLSGAAAGFIGSFANVLNGGKAMMPQRQQQEKQNEASMKHRVHKDGGITGRIGKDTRFAAHKDGAKVKSHSNFTTVTKDKVIAKATSGDFYAHAGGTPFVNKPWVLKDAPDDPVKDDND